jgi:hypothetical protein
MSMSDPFVDALHDRLTASGSPVTESGDRRTHALADRWWGEFVEVLGQKVGAWNERQAPLPPINFTRGPDRAVHVWHRSAEVTLAREGDAIRVSTRLGTTSAGPALLHLRTDTDGTVVASVDGHEMTSAASAAEHVLTPVFTEAFLEP